MASPASVTTEKENWNRLINIQFKFQIKKEHLKRLFNPEILFFQTGAKLNHSF